ncbi:hypothetical protein [Niallia sp. RD1]|uniref:hypothetical protein n=1 Tax=Niallia sp. RD1 TaxID=2962858 RepID=UPI0020C19B87|nr:hypothetical protein [Niallia sp. RD1]UTI40720.1 hypothetical protein NKG37_17690 [Niallia sp. RD1]
MNKKQAAYLYSLLYPITRNEVIARKIVFDVLKEYKHIDEKIIIRKAINKAIEAGKAKIG